MSKPTQLLDDADFEGASYQSWPDTPAPYKVRGRIETAKTTRLVTICMTREEAEDVIRMLASFLGDTVTIVSTGSST